jgi:low temperature requirement protein LtrA
MNFYGLVKAPRLWVADCHSQRRVTWMELFFDLIFVAAVAEVGVPLTTDYSLSGLSRREIPYTMNT